MKWLDPKKNELPGDAFIAVINLNPNPEEMSNLVVKVLKHNVNFDYYNDLEEWYEDYGLISAEDYNLKKYYEKDIVAWMYLPDPIEEKFCQKKFDYYFDFEEEI